MQLAPTYVYKGLIISKNGSRNFFALGFGARYRLGPHVSIVSEYYKTFRVVFKRLGYQEALALNQVLLYGKIYTM